MIAGAYVRQRAPRPAAMVYSSVSWQGVRPFLSRTRWPPHFWVPWACGSRERASVGHGAGEVELTVAIGIGARKNEIRL